MCTKYSMALFPTELVAQAVDLLKSCQKARLKLATAESCTGGLIFALLTEIPGASSVVERGFITYSNAAKLEVLGVAEKLLQNHGAVSKAVACAMVTGVFTRCPDVSLAIGVTGIAGPDGGSQERPVGLVHLAAARRGMSRIHQQILCQGERTEVRLATTAIALTMLSALATSNSTSTLLSI